MKEIQLTQGKIAIVDDEDFEYLSQWKWYYNNGYAARETGKHPNQCQVFMHREIMKTPNGMDTDHIDRNPLNNRRENLRICTHIENTHNQKIHSDNTSGFKGVSLHGRKWRARIRAGRKYLRLGTFDSPEEAARFYDLAALAYHGEFAKTNFGETK